MGINRVKYKNIAIVPLRGGSKSIPLKNIKIINGKPLCYWVIEAAQNCKMIDKIIVATDSKRIENIVNSFEFKKIEIFKRSKKSATDTASTEKVLLEVSLKYDFENMILLQATSPLTTSRDIENAFKIFNQKKYDSLLSVVREKRFIWENKKDRGVSINYDYKNRPRRQDFTGYLVENGAIYITSRNNFLKTKNRLSGKIGIYEMPDYTYYEIDEEKDWIVVENLLRHYKKKYNENNLKNIKIFAMDIDGVLTDGCVYYSKKGEELLKFSRIDGKGIELLKARGIKVWAISSEDSKIVRNRLEKLKIDKIFLGIKQKLKLIEKELKKEKLCLKNLFFIGDDIQDLEIIKSSGFSAAPKNAIEIIKQNSKYICQQYGGHGAIREAADLLLNNL